MFRLSVFAAYMLTPFPYAPDSCELLNNIYFVSFLLVILNIVNIRNQLHHWYQSHRQYMLKCHLHLSLFYAVNSLGTIRWTWNAMTTVQFQWLIHIHIFIRIRARTRIHSSRAHGLQLQLQHQPQSLLSQTHIGPIMDMMTRWLSSIESPLVAEL